MCFVLNVCAQGVPLIATSPVRHEPPITILPTPVEVHKFPGGPWPIDLVVPPPGNIDSDLDAAAAAVNGGVADSPVPSPAGPGEMAVGALVLPPGVRPDLAAAAGLLIHTAAAVSHGHHGPPQSIGDSFDDDTVVSFDDLSDVVMSAVPSCGASDLTVTSSQARSSYASSLAMIGRADDIPCHGGLDGLRQTAVSLFGTVDGQY